MNAHMIARVTKWSERQVYQEPVDGSEHSLQEAGVNTGGKAGGNQNMLH